VFVEGMTNQSQALTHVVAHIMLRMLCCILQVKGFEAIRGVTLDAEQFSVDNDCMTPTFKFKRPQLQKRYQVRNPALC
jgi:long-subunit acyl-CoA synthetase (AMP-forming)